MGRLRPWIVGGVSLLAALLAFRVLAGRLEGTIAARLEEEAARLGARARVERVRVSLWPPLRLSGVRIDKPGQWEARVDDVSVGFRPWEARGAVARVSAGAVVVTLPAEIELDLHPSVWEVDAKGWAELRAPIEGLALGPARAGPAGGFEVRLAPIPIGRLGRLLLEGTPTPDLGVVEGEGHWEPRAGNGFEARWRLAAIGAESRGKAGVSRGAAGARLDLEVDVERLDLVRLLGALGLDRPVGAEGLGQLTAAVGVSGPLEDPASLVVTQRLVFVPPPTLPPAIERLRGDFTHEVPGPGGTTQTIDVSPVSPDFIPRADVPPLFLQALLLGEDAAFFSHRGVDLTELPKALAANLAQGSPVRGASTITQQLAKNLFLGREKTLHRKIQELALAFLLESALGKDRILEIYLNVIEWGPALYGLRPAARHYFGKEPRALTPKETAFLVILIPGPVRYQRSFNEGALSPGLEPLVTNLLAKLRASGALSEEEYQGALAETLVFRRPQPDPPSEALP